MANFFRVEGIGAVKHNEATKQKLNALNGNKSGYIREAIKKFASEEGFSWNGESMPGFVTPDQWQEYQERQRKSQAKKSNRIDYGYLIAFWWLQYIFEDLPASTILRRAILMEK